MKLKLDKEYGFDTAKWTEPSSESVVCCAETSWNVQRRRKEILQNSITEKHKQQHAHAHALKLAQYSEGEDKAGCKLKLIKIQFFLSQIKTIRKTEP